MGPQKVRVSPAPPLLEGPATAILEPRLATSYKKLKGYFLAAERHERQLVESISNIASPLVSTITTTTTTTGGIKMGMGEGGIKVGMGEEGNGMEPSFVLPVRQSSRATSRPPLPPSVVSTAPLLSPRPLELSSVPIKIEPPFSIVAPPPPPPPPPGPISRQTSYSIDAVQESGVEREQERLRALSEIQFEVASSPASSHGTTSSLPLSLQGLSGPPSISSGNPNYPNLSIQQKDYLRQSQIKGMTTQQEQTVRAQQQIALQRQTLMEERIRVNSGLVGSGFGGGSTTSVESSSLYFRNQ